jgi:hypothetical protein
MPRLLNLTTIPTDQLEQLAGFCYRRFPSASLTKLAIEVQQVSPWTRLGQRYGISGMAYGEVPAGVVAPKGVERYIRLSVMRLGRYPRGYTYRKRVGALIFRDWEEEFVAVLGHELYHIHQFKNPHQQDYHLEVQAERFAKQLLEEFRADRDQVRCG